MAFNPLTVIGLEDPVPVLLPTLLVTVYWVIVNPPVSAGAVNATVAVVDPVAVAVPMVGAPGTVVGVILLLAALAGPVPIELVAVTVKV
jgi:hypothetical protein